MDWFVLLWMLVPAVVFERTGEGTHGCLNCRATTTRQEGEVQLAWKLERRSAAILCAVVLAGCSHHSFLYRGMKWTVRHQSFLYRENEMDSSRVDI